MKTMLIKIAIVLFVRWLKKGKSESNGLLRRILHTTTTPTELIDALTVESTVDDIWDIVTDIEDETLGNVFSDMIGK